MISVLRTHKSQNNPKNARHQELTLDSLRPGSWINMVNPTRQELEDVSRLTSVPLDFLNPALDIEESSRIDFEEADEDSGFNAAMLMVLNVPKQLGDFKFDTIPLGVVITDSYFITVCLEETEILPGGKYGVSGFCTWKRTRFLLQILYRTADTYLKYLNDMNRTSTSVETELRKSMKNEELFKLMELARGMTFFTGSLKSSRMTIDKLIRALRNPLYEDIVKMREEDEDLLEDATVEYDQAYDMVTIYRDVLSGMMDAFASIISNNLNIVMKFLAAVTIIISIPTIVSSFWGMNVPVPFMENPIGFTTVFIIAVALSAAVAIWLWWKRML